MVFFKIAKVAMVERRKGKQHKASCKSKPVSSISQPLQRMKEIKREFSVARTPQQNKVAERNNRTLIKAARTMLADSFLPIPFWAEAVNTACYVQNRGINIMIMQVSKKILIQAKRDDKGKSHVDLPTGVRDFRVEFEEFSFNSTNRVNAVSAPVNVAKLTATNSTNSFNTTSPSVNAISTNFGIVGKSSFVDPSKYPDDPDMPELEDIVYSDDEEDVDSLNSAAGGIFLYKMPRECLKIIESKSKVRQSRAKAVVAKVGMSSSTPVISFDVAELKDMVKALLLDKTPVPSSNSIYHSCSSQSSRVKLCNLRRGNNFNQNRGGNFNQFNFNPPSFNQGQLNRPQVNQAPVYQTPISQTQRVSQTDFESYVKANDAILRNMQIQEPRSKYAEPMPKHSKSEPNLQIQMAALTEMMSKWTLPGNTITNPKEDLKGITTRSGVAYQGLKTPSPSKQGTKVTNDQVQTPSSQDTAPVQPSVIQSESQALISEPIVAPVSAPMPNLKPSIPYPSRRDNEKRRDQANEQIEKFYEIFKDMTFEISFTDALTLMPKFALTLKALVRNKEKLNEMARTPMNKHCSAVILNKLPQKLGDPEKFLIPCEFPGMDECLALADLGASINLMLFFVWEALLLPELTPTCMTLEHADRSGSKPIDIAKDVSFKLTGRALIDVHKGELTLRIRKEAITYNLDQTEADAFLGLEDDPDSPKINPFYYNPEEDILLLEAILNSEPLPPLPNHEQYLPSYKKELKVCEAKTVK
nr:reverse transcriptase domain-containing protein [Tanacetum cinerariifolium]